MQDTTEADARMRDVAAAAWTWGRSNPGLTWARVHRRGKAPHAHVRRVHDDDSKQDRR